MLSLSVIMSQYNDLLHVFLLQILRWNLHEAGTGFVVDSRAYNRYFI